MLRTAAACQRCGAFDATIHALPLLVVHPHLGCIAAVQNITGLHEVIPTYLAASCPALRSLRLRFCSFQEPSTNILEETPQQQQHQPPQSSPAPPLQALHVTWGTECLPHHVLAAGLASLPHLTSLALWEMGVSTHTAWCQVFMAVAGQLTHLSLSSGGGLYSTSPVSRLLEVPDVALSLRHLRRIDLVSNELDDAGLRALTVHLPLLTHVSVEACQLQTSHADVSCNWEELHASSYLEAAQLILLPLRGIRKLEAHTVYGYDMMPGSRSTHELAAALAAAPGCVLSCACTELCFHCDAGTLPVPLPRWRCEEVRWLTVSTPKTERLTPAAVEALGSLLQRTPSCKDLCIEDFGPPDAASSPLLPALISTEISEVRLRYAEMTEAQLLAWCAGGAVGHSIAVSWEYGTLAGQLARVYQALREGGGGVTLKCQGIQEVAADDDDDGDDHGCHGDNEKAADEEEDS
jgi:hypothetical protein